MSSDKRPDIVVAVDFGTTYTGVGWVCLQANNAIQTPIQIIQNWPGCSTRNEQKVPTCLVYNPDGSLTSWGFLCEEDDGPEKHRKDLFKIFLDSNKTEDVCRLDIPSATPVSRTEAQYLATTYLQQIYNHVKDTVESRTATVWADLTVEYIFSVPTTWRSQATINIFKKVIAAAGFGRESPSHTATVELTESEAAAVGTIKSGAVRFHKDDIFLSVDAGGGTTDLALMKVVEASEPFPTLSQITEVDGIGIGSTFIDRDFLDLASSRIRPFPDLLHLLPPDCIKRLVQTVRFQTAKHRFGEHAWETPKYKLPLQGVHYKFSSPEAGIDSGELILMRDEMQSLFDPHVDRIIHKIGKQLDWARKNGHSQHIKYMILSGGLGSSSYLLGDSSWMRLQKLENGSTPVLIHRKARASYGLVCNMKFNPIIHKGEVLEKDPLDGEIYATQQIDWIIRKGDVIDPSKPISHSFNYKIDPGDAVRKFDGFFVISHLEKDNLPRSVAHPGFIPLCTVKSDLTGIRNNEMERQKLSQGLFSRSKKYYNLNFDVKVTVGPADLRFELWFLGKKFSRSHDPIQVAWD
ncbi:Hsp70 family chaperone [Penicillium maclennaniae]|uniref:Hsp70 family chaperone n=1 Tax=Penicillium maclennaniae TaxID=1343394 RepID=UPI002540BC59|nr:Hsp70 family chaperone [Penicillium maclennaniae]KAJ5678491.1 Hsp70 family chaperone [Penicillium maclennaniae]